MAAVTLFSFLWTKTIPHGQWHWGDLRSHVLVEEGFPERSTWCPREVVDQALCPPIRLIWRWLLFGCGLQVRVRRYKVCFTSPRPHSPSVFHGWDPGSHFPELPRQFWGTVQMESQWGKALALNLGWLLFLILGLVLTVQVITEPWKLQNSFLGIYIIPGFILVTLLLPLSLPSVDHNPGHCWLPGKISSVQLLSCVRLFATSWTAARQASLSPAPEACSNSRPSSQWCHLTISSSAIPFSCLQSFPAIRVFPMSQLFASGQSIGVSASTSALPMNIQDFRID